MKQAAQRSSSNRRKFGMLMLKFAHDPPDVFIPVCNYRLATKLVE